MEQLVARRAHNPKVIGSSPVPATQVKKPLREILGAFLLGDAQSKTGSLSLFLQMNILRKYALPQYCTVIKHFRTCTFEQIV